MASSATNTAPKRYLVEHLDPELGQWSSLEYLCIAKECGSTAVGADAAAASSSDIAARFWLTCVPEALKLTPELEQARDSGLVRVCHEGVEDMVLCKKKGDIQGEQSEPAEKCGSCTCSSTQPESQPQVPSSATSTAQSTPSSSFARVPKSRICLLDPRATKDLSPSDGDLFDWFLFGGILGDDPPRDRTGELRVKGFPTRRLGAVQMTTDTAVRVTRMVVEQGMDLGLSAEERLASAKECDGDGGKKIEWVDMPEIKVNKAESVEMPFRYVKGADGQPIMPEGMLELIKKDSERGFDDFIPDIAADVNPDGTPLDA